MGALNCVSTATYEYLGAGHTGTYACGWSQESRVRRGAAQPTCQDATVEHRAPVT